MKVLVLNLLISAATLLASMPSVAVDADIQHRYVRSRISWIQAQMARGKSIIDISNMLGVRVAVVQEELNNRYRGTYGAANKSPNAANRAMPQAAVPVFRTKPAPLIYLRDAVDLLGEWRLEAVAPALDRPRVAQQKVWEFRSDGVLHISGTNAASAAVEDQSVNYDIKNGLIVADVPGRPGVSTELEVYQRTENSMILKGGLEGFYFLQREEP